MSSIARIAVLAVLGAVACGGAPHRSLPELPRGLDAETRAAYVAEDADALRVALRGTLLGSGLRRALELSRLLQQGECRHADLDAVRSESPNWVVFVEHGDCAAQIGREREALEDFVHAVDLADTPEAVGYVVRRVCRAADETGLETLGVMCVGEVE